MQTKLNLTEPTFRPIDGVIVYAASVVLSYTLYFVCMFFGDVPILANYALVQICNVICVLGYLIYKKWNPKPIFSNNSYPVNLPKAGLSAVGAVALVAQNLMLVFAFSRLMVSLDISMEVAMPPMDSAWQLIVTVLVVCVLPAVGEEMLFRGIMVSALKSKGQWYAVILSGLIFALMHFNPAQLVHQFIIGTVFAYVYIKTGKLIYCMILHFINNLTAVVADRFFPAINSLANFTFNDIIILSATTLVGLAVVFACIKGITKGAAPLAKFSNPFKILIGDRAILALVLALVAMVILSVLLS